MISSKLSNATCVHSFQAINRAMLHGVTLTVTLCYRYLCLKMNLDVEHEDHDVN